MSLTDKTYIRFVCFQSIGRQRSRLDLFKAIDEAVESEQAPGWAIAEARNMIVWQDQRQLRGEAARQEILGRRRRRP